MLLRCFGFGDGFNVILVRLIALRVILQNVEISLINIKFSIKLYRSNR